jgi:hypothetical protein
MRSGRSAAPPHLAGGGPTGHEASSISWNLTIRAREREIWTSPRDGPSSVARRWRDPSAHSQTPWQRPQWIAEGPRQLRFVCMLPQPICEAAPSVINNGNVRRSLWRQQGAIYRSLPSRLPALIPRPTSLFHRSAASSIVVGPNPTSSNDMATSRPSLMM